MSQISAAENLNIDMQPGKWTLLMPSDEGLPKVLVENNGSALHYSPAFGSTRRLPTSGVLETRSIEQVVLGWSQEDEAWHLGLVLDAQLAGLRGSRWCELVHWPDPEQTVFVKAAQQSGQHLAQTLSLPFRLIPPRPIERAEPIPLPDLPLKSGIWTLDRLDGGASGQLAFKRHPAWARTRYTRILWYLLWVVVYVVVSVATLTSDLALPNAGTLLPNPQILPFLGLGVAVLLIGLIFQQIIQLMTRPDTILLDPHDKSLSAWRGRQMQWRIPGQDVQSVYITEVIKKNDKTPISYHGEINLHLGGGEFGFVLQQDQQEDNAHARHAHKNRPRQDEVMPLTAADINTDLQAAALYVAEALGDLPVWYDVRVK